MINMEKLPGWLQKLRCRLATRFDERVVSMLIFERSVTLPEKIQASFRSGELAKWRRDQQTLSFRHYGLKMVWRILEWLD